MAHSTLQAVPSTQDKGSEAPVTSVDLRREFEAVDIASILAQAAQSCTPLREALEVWKDVTFNYDSTDSPDFVPTPSLAV